MVEAASVRLRLIIPAAVAAAATYAALVREGDEAPAWRTGEPETEPAGGAVLTDRRETIAVTEKEPTAPATATPSSTSAPAPEHTPRPAVEETAAPDHDAMPSPDEAEPPREPTAAAEPTTAPSSVAAEHDAPVDQAPTEPVEQSIAWDRPEPPAEQIAAATDDWTEMEGIPELTARPDTAAPDPVAEPAPSGPVLDTGRFELGGWAAAPGHSVVSAVTFTRRLDERPPASHVVLALESSENVPSAGLVVLADPGFAPDQEGFTLLLAAADPGPFSAAGTYRVFGATP